MSTTYRISDVGGSESIEADDMADACRLAEEWISEGSETTNETMWAEAYVQEEEPFDLDDIDRSIDAFSDAFHCWSIVEIESSELDDPASDVPAPPTEAVDAARSLGKLRRYMLAANEEAEATRETVIVTLHPVEPECTDDEHDWQSPYSIVGGIEENPGCWGHGGGVIINECCMHCGCKKVTDTWAQNPENGVQGLTSLSYEPDYYTDEIEEMVAD